MWVPPSSPPATPLGKGTEQDGADSGPRRHRPIPVTKPVAATADHRSSPLFPAVGQKKWPPKRRRRALVHSSSCQRQVPIPKATVLPSSLLPQANWTFLPQTVAPAIHFSFFINQASTSWVSPMCPAQLQVPVRQCCGPTQPHWLMCWKAPLPVGWDGCSLSGPPSLLSPILAIPAFPPAPQDISKDLLCCQTWTLPNYL